MELNHRKSDLVGYLRIGYALWAIGCGSSSPSATSPGAAGPDGQRSTGGAPGSGGAGSAMPTAPFQAVSPQVGAAMVKMLLTGLALTDDEFNMVGADPAALPRLVDQWAARPEWRAKLLDFFKQAFQQT